MTKHFELPEDVIREICKDAVAKARETQQTVHYERDGLRLTAFPKADGNDLAEMYIDLFNHRIETLKCCRATSSAGAPA